MQTSNIQDHKKFNWFSVMISTYIFEDADSRIPYKEDSGHKAFDMKFLETQN